MPDKIRSIVFPTYLKLACLFCLYLIVTIVLYGFSTMGAGSNSILYWILFTIFLGNVGTYIWYDYICTYLVLDDKKIEKHSGVLSHSVLTVRYSKVESIELQQGWFDWIINSCTLVVTGTGNFRMEMPYVSMPSAESVKQFLLEKQELFDNTKPTKA